MGAEYLGQLQKMVLSGFVVGSGTNWNNVHGILKCVKCVKCVEKWLRYVVLHCYILLQNHLLQVLHQQI